MPVVPINDEAKKHNQNLPGMGGVFNLVNMHVYHYAGNNPVKLVDPDGRSPGPYEETFNTTGGNLPTPEAVANIAQRLNPDARNLIDVTTDPVLGAVLEITKKGVTKRGYAETSGRIGLAGGVGHLPGAIGAVALAQIRDDIKNNPPTWTSVPQEEINKRVSPLSLPLPPPKILDD